jgi:uncharacterized protein
MKGPSYRAVGTIDPDVSAIALPTWAAMERQLLEAYPVLSETNLSVLFAVDDLVYKTKRPRAFAFVDQRTLADRQRLCIDEVALNRRFSPDVYLRVVDIVDDGHVVDCAVVMQRMPSERSLARLVRAGEAVEPCVRAVARQMARHHAAADRSDEINAAGTNAAVSELWRLSVDEMRDLVPAVLDGSVLDEIAERSARYLAGRRPLFDERIACGHIVDGHGDLLADDIYCLDDGPRLLDCLEFADKFRLGDVLLDIAFLAMDLERLGRTDIAEAFIDAYGEMTDEHHPKSLVDHYVAYRALVRAKVLGYRARSGVVGAADEANQLLALAADHLALGEVRLVVIGGLPGTGKTTLAETLSRRRGWAVLSTDAVRRELVDRPTSEQAFGEGTHDPGTNVATYRTLFERARTALGLGERVILDGSFADRRWRREARDLADENHAVLTELRCVTPSAVAASRLLARAGTQSTSGAVVLSDATPTIAAEMAQRFAPWPAAIIIDTAAEVDEVLAATMAALG